MTEKLNCRCLLGTDVLAVILVLPESVKYLCRLSGISGGFVEILKRLQKNYRISEISSEAITSPESAKLFQRLSATVSTVLKRGFLEMKFAGIESV